MPTIELKPGFVWTCDHCGKTYGVAGEAPAVVKCTWCDAEYDTGNHPEPSEPEPALEQVIEAA